MNNTTFDNITGDGTVYANGIVGLISRNRFLDEELPENAFIYLLYRQKRNRHTWLLENLEEVENIPQPRDNYGFSSDEPPEIAYVCFCIEPGFDYLSINEEDDYDTYIKWNTGHTMKDIINMSNEEE